MFLASSESLNIINSYRKFSAAYIIYITVHLDARTANVI